MVTIDVKRGHSLQVHLVTVDVWCKLRSLVLTVTPGSKALGRSSRVRPEERRLPWVPHELPIRVVWKSQGISER